MCVHLLLPQAAIPLCKLYGTSHFLLVRPCGRGEGGCQMEWAVFLSFKKPNFMDGFLMATECIIMCSQKLLILEIPLVRYNLPSCRGENTWFFCLGMYIVRLCLCVYVIVSITVSALRKGFLHGGNIPLCSLFIGDKPLTHLPNTATVTLRLPFTVSVTKKKLC